MITTLCALCEENQQIHILYPPTFSEKSLTAHVYSARRLPDHIHYQIVRCDRCGLVFSSPILPVKEIASLYRTSVCTYDEQVSYIIQTYMNMFTQYIPYNKKLRVVEVGCGNGFFLDALVKSGVTDVWGVEPGKSMVKQAPKYLQKRIKTDVFKKNQFAPNSIDVVCCFHTIDHLPDPKSFVAESFRILKPGGYLLVVCHDTDGVSVKIFGEKSPIFDIEHIYLFNKKTLSDICLRYGYTVKHVFNLINAYPIPYWIRMSGLPIQIKTIATKLISTLGLAHQSFAFAGGNIGIVAQKNR